MKRIIIFLIILFISILITTNSFAEEKIKNIISINFLGFAFGNQNIEFERIFGPKSSMAFYWAEGGYASANLFDIEFEATEQRIAYRYYLSERNPEGFWLGSNFTYSTGNIKKNDTEYAYKTSMLFLGIEAGHRWLFNSWNNFNITHYIIFRWMLTDNISGSKESSENFKYPFVGYNISFCFNIGWGW